MQIRYDANTPIKKFTTDEQTGFVHIKHVPIAQVMVQPYLKADGTKVMEAKTPENLLNAETVDSANHVPVTNDHPSELVTKDNAQKYMDGFTADNAHVENNRLYNDLTITDKDLIKAVNDGKQELSIGFETRVVPQKGELNGVKYDAIQKDIKINHIAVVNRGRAGHSVRLTADSATAFLDSQKGQKMPEDKTKVIDANNAQSSASASNSNSNSNSSSSGSNSNSNTSQDPKDKLIAQLRAQVASLQQQLKQAKGSSNSSSSSASNEASNDSKDAKIDSLESQLKEANDQLEQYKGDALDKKIAEKLDLENKVKSLVGDSYSFKDKGGKLKSDKQMKIDAIKAVDDVADDFDEKAKKDVYVDTYFDIIKDRKPQARVNGLNPNAVSTKQDSLQSKAEQLLQERYNLATRKEADK